jgi:hypothetical protein
MDHRRIRDLPGLGQQQRLVRSQRIDDQGDCLGRFGYLQLPESANINWLALLAASAASVCSITARSRTALARVLHRQ